MYHSLGNDWRGIIDDMFLACPIRKRKYYFILNCMKKIGSNKKIQFTAEIDVPEPFYFKQIFDKESKRRHLLSRQVTNSFTNIPPKTNS